MNIGEYSLDTPFKFIVGVVREIKGTSVIIRMLEQNGQLVYLYNGKKYPGIMIGSYVGIVRGQYVIVGKVESEYAFDTQKDTNSMEFKKERFVREITVKIIGSFKGNEFQFGMVAFPQIFNDVVLLSEDQIKRIIDGNSKKIEIPKLNLGKLWPDGTSFNIKWYDLFNSHIAIFGNTGSGKSNTLAKLYHELFSLKYKDKPIAINDSKFIFFDFNGEYIGSESITSEKKIYNLNTSKNQSAYESDKLIIPGELFWDQEMLSVLFGATEQTQQPFLNRVLKYYFDSEKNFKSNLSEHLTKAFIDIYAVSNGKGLDLFKHILDILDIPHDNVSFWIDKSLYNITLDKFYSEDSSLEWRESGKDDKKLYYWNHEEVKLEKEKANVRSKLDSIFTSDNTELLLTPMILLQIASYLQIIHELRYNMVQYDHIAPLLHRIESRVDNFSKIFEITDISEDIFEKSVNIISLKEVNQDMKLQIPLIVAKVTYAINKRNQNSKTGIFNLIIDEAHNILSSKSSRETEKWKDYRLEVFEEIIKEGRKFGYFLTLASQRPSDISPTIVSQIHNYFIHRLVNENDLKLLDKTLSTLDSVSKESIPNLAPGQVILTGTMFDLPLIVKVDMLKDEFAPNSGNANILKMWFPEATEKFDGEDDN